MMSETNCRWVSSTEPRVIPKRHAEECSTETCAGCLPCPLPHCRVCGKDHAEQTCATCTGEARENLTEIRRLCAAMPDEAAERGVDSQAMALIAPAADPEAWGHITTSLKVGRLPSGYLVCDRCGDPWPCKHHAGHVLHPLFVLGGWEQVWRDALDHETDARVTIDSAADYLDAQLTYMAGYEHAPFEDFAADLRRCRSHMESVLHDENFGDIANVGCFKCGGELERRLRKSGFEDHWTCRRCHQTYTSREYNLALRAKLEADA